MRVHDHGHACSGPPDYVAQMADVPTDGFGGIFQTYSRADLSWLAVYQNYLDRITSTVSQGSDPRSPDRASKLVVARAGNREANLSCVIGLPGRSLAAKVVVLVASRKPRDVGHVERDQARGGDYAAFAVIVPCRGRAVGLNFGNLVTAVPRRGRDLPGEVFERRALAFCVVCHTVSELRSISPFATQDHSVMHEQLNPGKPAEPKVVSVIV